VAPARGNGLVVTWAGRRVLALDLTVGAAGSVTSLRLRRTLRHQLQGVADLGPRGRAATVVQLAAHGHGALGQLAKVEQALLEGAGANGFVGELWTLERIAVVMFLPYPEALKGELDLLAGHIDTATDELEHAFALACQLGDPCWEAMAARGLGLLNATRGDHATATAWLSEAHTRNNRVTDRYQWVSAYVLDARIATALDHHDDNAGQLIDTLASLAARCDMRELVVRAHLYRGRLGDPAALASARLLGEESSRVVDCRCWHDHAAAS
jgi:hypothetical protein